MAEDLSFSSDGVLSKSRNIDQVAAIVANIKQSLGDSLSGLGTLAGTDETSEAFKQVWDPAVQSTYDLLDGVSNGLTNGTDQLTTNVKSFNHAEDVNVEGVTHHTARVE